MLFRTFVAHALLAGYVWLVLWIPLGDWNRQPGRRLLTALLAGRWPGLDDLAVLALVTLPAVLAGLAWKRPASPRPLLGAALAVDTVWLALQIRSWWLPYAFGTNVRWQLEYAQGPTTKVLPSFGNHIPPDAMHLAIHVLLVLAIATGLAALRHQPRQPIQKT